MREATATLMPRRSGSQRRQRVRRIGVALDPSEFAVIEEKATTAGLSKSSFLRAAALGSAGPRARRSPPLNAEVLAHAVAALNKTGSNLNQIARILNAGQAAGSKEAVEALTETREAVGRILEIVGRRDRNV
jgi:hypothetical protein